MRCGTILAAVVFAALSFAGNAFAGAPDGPGPFADYVVDHHQGCAIQPPNTTTCVPVFANRTDPTAALGVNESPPGPNQNPPLGSFYSMGFSGLANGTAFLTLGFDNPICNVPGNDLAIELFEITTEPYPNEVLNVFVSADNVNYVFAGTVIKDGTVGMPASVPVANFVKLVDVSNPNDFVNTIITGDAYDVDAVRALNSASCPSGKIEICKARTNGMSGKVIPVHAQRRRAVHGEGRLLLRCDLDAGRRQPRGRASDQPADRGHERLHETEQQVVKHRSGQPDGHRVRPARLDCGQRDAGDVHERACGRDGRRPEDLQALVRRPSTSAARSASR